MSAPRENDGRLLAWTGERCVPWVDDMQVMYEHLHRYGFAMRLAAGKRVLDLGSGEGYGCALLSTTAAAVLGVEIDPDTVEHARRTYPRDNLDFRLGSALELDDLAEASFDLVVCFEVVEHLGEHDALLAQITRLLAPDGILVLSTPDREIYTDAANYRNPFHVRELNRTEFEELLAGSFAHHRLWGQSIVVGSQLLQIDSASPFDVERIHVQRNGDHWERCDPAPVRYLAAVASQVPLPPLPELSLLDHRGSTALAAPTLSPADVENDGAYELWEPERLGRQVAIYEAEVAALLTRTAELGRESDQLRQELHATEETTRRLEETLRRGEETARSAKERSAALQASLDEITTSRAWRAVVRYRRLRTAIRGPRRPRT